MKLKKGDLVNVRDYSYSRFVVDGKLVDSNKIKGKKTEDVFVIIETGIKTAPVSYQRDIDGCNNTVIQKVGNGVVGFIEEKFLQPAKHKITIDGKTIEISHESFLNLKKELAD